MAKNKERLGKGIRALLNNMDQSVDAPTPKEEVVQKLSTAIVEIPVDQIEVNPFQPRKTFDPTALEELSQSISVHGLIQPITVRRLSQNQYQLISGERRLRASKKAGLKNVPAYIRLANDQEMLEMALVENIQREELNPIEVGITYQRLIDECNLTHEKLSDRLAKNRSTITNYLRLLKLPPQIQNGLRDKAISMGHARSLAGVQDVALQLSLYNTTLQEQLSVRQIEDLIRRQTQPAQERKAKSSLPLEYREIQDRLGARFGMKVTLKRSANGKGQIIIPFGDDSDLNNILDTIED